MKLPYKISDAASQLYRAGISYHAYGIIKNDGKALFNYYKCDKITASQQKTIAEFCPDVMIRGCASQYAPELRAVLVCFPKAAWYRINGVKK